MFGLAPALWAWRQPYHFWTEASVYGPGFYWPGNRTAAGDLFDAVAGPELVGIAHRTLRLGTKVAVEIPPQRDAWGEGLRTTGALIWTQVVDRGPYANQSGAPRHDGRDVDLTMGLLREAGWFDRSITAFWGSRSEYREAFRWGVRTIKVHVF